MDGYETLPHDGGAGVASPGRFAVDLSRLTFGEQLFLWRLGQTGRRYPHGAGNMSGRMSQVEAAVHLGVPKGIYEEAERGEIPCVPIAEMLRDDLPTVPTVAQACRLARRRSGLALASLAVGTRATTVPTVLRMEARGDPRLVTYWEDRGFVFPAENRAV